MFEVFSEEWLSAWHKETATLITEGAAGWSIVLKVQPDAKKGVPDGKAILIDFAPGAAPRLVFASAADEAKASVVLSAAPQSWKALIDGSLDPVMGVMMGKVSLERGGVGALAPHAKTAKALLQAATRIPTRYPEELG